MPLEIDHPLTFFSEMAWLKARALTYLSCQLHYVCKLNLK